MNSPGGLDAGSYALSESAGPAGYTPSLWTCVVTGTATPVTVTAGSVTVGLGDDVTCSITNNDRPGTIVIVKNATPASGTFSFGTTGSTSGPGTAWPGSFTLDR